MIGPRQLKGIFISGGIDRMAKKKETETEVKQRDFHPEKAKGELRLIAEWLSGRTREEKLVALISDELLRHRDVLNQENLYDGDIVDEMLNAWEQELQENDPNDSPEMQFVRGYCIALNRMGGLTASPAETA
jgi:hypothetical protein